MKFFKRIHQIVPQNFHLFFCNHFFLKSSNVILKFFPYSIAIFDLIRQFVPKNVRGAFNKFQDYFCTGMKIVVDSWKFRMLLLYIAWDDWPIFMILGSNEQLHQQLEYNLLKPHCHSWWIFKMQSEREDTLEERYAIKFCFKLGKNATETYGMLQTTFGASCMNRASVFEWHERFKEG